MPIDACFIGVVVDNSKYILAGFSVMLAIAAVALLKFLNLSSKKKIALIYTHLFGLFFPLSLFTTNAACGALCLPCFEHPLGLAILAVPSALVFSTIAGFIVIPAYFFRPGRNIEIRDREITRFIERQANALNIKPPRVYAANKPRPFAFSFRTFRSAIVVSVGLVDILKKKELQAVMLHELAHINNKASAFKLSAFLMRFSPFSFFRTFKKELDEEEKMADFFACDIQGTCKHLEAAKRKIIKYDEANMKYGQRD